MERFYAYFCKKKQNMNLFKDLFNKLLRIKKVMFGQDKYIKKDITLNVSTYGQGHCSWTIFPEILNEKSVIYSFGVGDDISFDLALINHFDVQIFAFDPTPKSVDWVKLQNLSKQFSFFPIGLANFEGKAKFNPPQNPDHISATMLERPETSDQAYKVEVKPLSTIMEELGHRYIDILKMDIEGTEYQVIDDMLSKNIKPGQVLIEFHHRFKGVGAKKTARAVKQLREMGYRVFHISDTGEEISFILANLAKNTNNKA
jgi:FkbM family methyltransferase